MDQEGSKGLNHCCETHHLMLEKDWGNEGNRTKKADIRKTQFLTADETRKAIF